MVKPVPGLLKAPPLPDSENGILAPIPHDRETSSEVLAVTIQANDSVTASISSGAAFFKVKEETAYNLVREVVDPSELPHGHKGPIYYWAEEEAASSDGVKPLVVTKGQRIHVTVAAKVPEHALPPGPFTGTLVLKGQTFSRTVPLQGTYLAVVENSPIGKKWKQMGGEQRLGEVRSNAHPTPDGKGTIQEFANGALYEVPGHGVFYLSSAVYAKWTSPEVAEAKTATGQIVRDLLGFPTEDTFQIPAAQHLAISHSIFEAGTKIALSHPAIESPRNIGLVRVHLGAPAAGPAEALRFQGGVIITRTNTQAFVVYGAIYTHYSQFGNLSDAHKQPFMGYPLTDEMRTPDGIGRFNHFDGGSIYWTPSTGAHEVHGVIRDKWASLGWERSFLGYPLSDETGLQDGTGRCSHFQGGSIYWTPSTGPHEVHGAIRDKWASLGWQQSFLGYPLNDETGLQDGIGRCNHFQGGSIYWTPATGAHEVHGAIRDKWASLGWQLGYLGYPVSDEQDWINPVNGAHGRISFFQHGRIGWTPQDGPIDLPDEFTVPGNVVTPSGTALGGWVKMTLRSNGSYTVQFHMHDSGLPDYDFQVRAIFAAKNGMTFVAQHSGHVEGTVSGFSPKRDDDHTDNGTNPFIQACWSDVVAGRLWVTKEYSATGVIGFIEDAAKAVLDVAAGAAGTTLGVIIGLGSEVGQLFGGLGIGGTLGVIAGVVVFAAGGGIVLAVVAGVAVGLVTNALIKQRQLSQQESQFAARVFGNTLPSPDQIILTNLSGLGGRAFTMPGVDKKIYVNLGDAFNDPLNYTNNGAYPSPGQVLIHELTHAWQIAHASFTPGIMCQGIVNQANYTFGQSVYVYGPPGPPWSDFNLEQQGAIVDQWFGGNPTPVAPNRQRMDSNDPYFGYIANNIRAGRT